MYKLIEMDNQQSVGYSYLNSTHRFSFNENHFYFGPLESSRVLTLTLKDKIIKVQTKNSNYTFEKVKQDG